MKRNCRKEKEYDREFVSLRVRHCAVVYATFHLFEPRASRARRYISLACFANDERLNDPVLFNRWSIRELLNAFGIPFLCARRVNCAFAQTTQGTQRFVFRVVQTNPTRRFVHFWCTRHRIFIVPLPRIPNYDVVVWSIEIVVCTKLDDNVSVPPDAYISQIFSTLILVD